MTLETDRRRPRDGVRPPPDVRQLQDDAQGDPLTVYQTAAQLEAVAPMTDEITRSDGQW